MPPFLLLSLLGFFRGTELIGNYLSIYEPSKEIYYQELAHVIVESGNPECAEPITQSKSEGWDPLQIQAELRFCPQAVKQSSSLTQETFS